MRQFGERLKILRKESNITQEALAEYLGISFQAVSKWENSLGFPDISLLPSIANFFGVTADYLLGIDLNDSDVKIEKALKEAKSYAHTGEMEKSKEVLKKALKIYPNDHRLLADLIEYKVLTWCDEEDWLAEIEQKARLLLRDCNVDKLRHKTIVNLAFAYSFGGKRDKVKETVELLPENAYSQRELLNLTVPVKERIKYVPECILADAERILCNCLTVSKHNIFWGDAEIAVDACQRTLKIIDSLGAEGYILYMQASAYEDLALAYGKQENREEMYNALENAMNTHISLYDCLASGGCNYKSPFFKGLEFSSEILSLSSEMSNLERFYNYIVGSNILKAYSSEEKFKNICKRLEKML